MKILYIARDTGGCGFFRCRQPAAFIKRMGLADTEVVQNNASAEQLLSASLVVFQEMGTAHSMEMVRICAENRIPFILEMDDFVHHVSPHNTAGFGAWNPSTLFIHRSMELLRSAVGATMSTPQMAREYFPYNTNIYVVPNYLDKDKWDLPLTKKSDGKIRIGWAGGNAHGDDLHMISKVIGKILKDFKGKVIFETVGMLPQELHGAFPIQATDGEDCQKCGYNGLLHHFPGSDLQNYPMNMASRGWDIAVAPVINNSFGNCKSDLKIKEFSALALPIVASDVVPYREAKESGADIALATTFEEWYNEILKLIKSQERRDEAGKANKEWISRYWIQDNAQKIFEIYKQIIAQYNAMLGKN